MSGSKRDYSNSDFVIPSRFRIKKKQRNGRANRALVYDAPAWQLFKMLGLKRPCLYSLKHHNLFLDKRHAVKHLIYDRKTLEVWKKAIRKYIKPPYFFCIEVGKEGQIHVHVVAAIDAGLPGIRRGYKTKTIRIIEDTDADRHRVISYMYKAPVPIWVDDDDKDEDLIHLCDWRERLDDYFDALERIQEEGKYKGLPQLSDYVFE